MTFEKEIVQTIKKNKMKKAVLILTTLFMTMSYAQETKQIPQVNVSGEGKVKVVPDQATISATVETKGNNAKEVKRQNDLKMEAVLKFIKKMNLAPADYQNRASFVEPAI